MVRAGRRAPRLAAARTEDGDDAGHLPARRRRGSGAGGGRRPTGDAPDQPGRRQPRPMDADGAADELAREALASARRPRERTPRRSRPWPRPRRHTRRHRRRQPRPPPRRRGAHGTRQRLEPRPRAAPAARRPRPTRRGRLAEASGAACGEPGVRAVAGAGCAGGASAATRGHRVPAARRRPARPTAPARVPAAAADDRTGARQHGRSRSRPNQVGRAAARRLAATSAAPAPQAAGHGQDGPARGEAAADEPSSSAAVTSWPRQLTARRTAHDLTGLQDFDAIKAGSRPSGCDAGGQRYAWPSRRAVIAAGLGSARRWRTARRRRIF